MSTDKEFGRKKLAEFVKCIKLVKQNKWEITFFDGIQIKLEGGLSQHH